MELDSVAHWFFQHALGKVNFLVFIGQEEYERHIVAYTLQTGTEKLVVSLRKVKGDTGMLTKQDFREAERERQ